MEHEVSAANYKDLVLFLATAGIVAPPSEDGHSYQVLKKEMDGPYVGPDEWLKQAPHREGSWWTEWAGFLAIHSGKPVPAQSSLLAVQAAAPLDDAPGRYVLQR